MRRSSRRAAPERHRPRGTLRPDPAHLGGHFAGTFLQYGHGLRLTRDPFGELVRFPGTRVKVVLHVPDPL